MEIQNYYCSAHLAAHVSVCGIYQSQGELSLVLGILHFTPHEAF